MSNDGNDDDVCIACNIALKNGDKFYFDVDGGYLHAACAGPEREGYVGADGEPLKDGDPIPAPKTWVDPLPSVAGGREALIEWLTGLVNEGGDAPIEMPILDMKTLLALLSSPRVEEWKPIGIAPRDGTRVLGFFPDHQDGLHDTNWSRHGVWASRAYPNQPTHWMPLPASPALSPPQGE